jgi:hypothetical protein
MQIRRALGVVGIVMGVVLPGNVFAEVEVSLIVAPHRQILGTPYRVTIEVANLGKETVEVIWPRHMALVLQDPSYWVFPGDRGVRPPSGGLSAAVTIAYEEVPPGGRLVYILESDLQVASLPRFCTPGKHRIGIRVPVHLIDGEEVIGEAWADVEVDVPTDADARAYSFLYGCDAEEGEECTCSRRMTGIPHGKASADLLQHFPTSTYAAYLIWKDLVRGISSGQNSVGVLLKDLGTSIESQSNSVPCDIPEWCDDNGWMSMQGIVFVRWRAKWFERVLEHHPDIWFADEIRLKLALDEYLLGDKTACQTGLEELADHGRPYVAMKAGELLRAMQSKNMLPGGLKDTPEGPKETEPRGSAEQ